MEELERLVLSRLEQAQQIKVTMEASVIKALTFQRLIVQAEAVELEQMEQAVVEPAFHQALQEFLQLERAAAEARLLPADTLEALV